MLGVGVTGRLIVEFEDVNLPISLSWEQMVILFDELGIEISDDRKKVTMCTSNALDERLNKALGFDSLELDEFGIPIEDNVELEKERVEAEKGFNYWHDKIYAGGLLSRDSVRSGLYDKMLATAYENTVRYFKDDNNYRVNFETNELLSRDGVMYIRLSKGRRYEVTSQFIDYLLGLDSWRGIAGGRFDIEVKRQYQFGEPVDVGLVDFVDFEEEMEKAKRAGKADK